MNPAQTAACALPKSLAAGLFLLLCAFAAPAAESIPGEDLLPDNSLLAVLVPDLQAGRAQFEKTRLAELFAQPMMQEFLQPVLAELKKQEAETLRLNPEAFAFGPALFNGGLAAAFFATPGDPQAAGIVAVFTPKAPADFLAALPPTLAKAMREGKLGQDLPAAADVGLAWAKERLIFCAPRARLANLLAGGDAPKTSLAQIPSYAKARERLSGSVAWAYAAPQAFFSLAAANAKDPAQLAWLNGLWAGLGLYKLEAVALGLGFRNGELSAEGNAWLSAPNTAVFSLCYPAEATPIAAEAFRIAAVDSPYVAAGYFNFAGLLPLLRRNLEAADPRAVGMLEMSVQSVNQFLKCDLQKDLLENLDGHFVVAQTSADTALPMLFVPGLVYSFGAKNPARFEACLGEIGALLTALPGPFQGTLKLKKIFHEDRTIYYLSGPLIPLSPAVCVAEGRLLVGTSLNAVRRTLEQLPKKESILANKDFQQALARAAGEPFSQDKIPPLFAYGIDQGSGHGALLLAGAYLAAASGLQFMNAALPAPALGAAPNRVQTAAMAVLRQVDLGFWPDQAFFAPYRKPTAAIAKSDAASIHWHTELPPPLPSLPRMDSGPGMVAVVAIGAGLALPVLARARDAARRQAMGVDQAPIRPPAPPGKQPEF